jgi:uncharacterized membrane protein YvlD (DUF360 family)
MVVALLLAIQLRVVAVMVRGLVLAELEQQILAAVAAAVDNLMVEPVDLA